MVLHKAQEGCRNHIKGLVADARIIVNEHWRFHYRNNASLPPQDKAKLNVWLRQRGDSLEIYWTHYKFIKLPSYASAKVLSTYIPKGASHQYPTQRLTRQAKSWEIETVLDIEKRMAKIRAEFADVSKALTALKRAERKAVARAVSNPD